MHLMEPRAGNGDGPAGKICVMMKRERGVLNMMELILL